MDLESLMKCNETLTQDERLELFGCLIDAVEDWLEARGFTPEDFPNDDREGDESEVIIYGSDFDDLADRFSDVLGIDRYVYDD